ncbi:MAG TPA: hypothetical protein VJR27_03260 [Candidatus Saccharimonadales bacterium]|nr:hypothetical protein [Candidatus Saccharimonadales bacterium]
MAEQYLEPDNPTVEMFAALPVGEVAEVPIDALTPTIVDDMTSSHTPGPIEAYALRVRSNANAKRIGQVIIWIADGNHRYFEHVREGRNTIATRKIIPDPDHDIRVMFSAEGKWEEM